MNQEHGTSRLAGDCRRSSPDALVDPRVAAFCSVRGPEIFHSISHRHEIWTPDPYDVASIHARARDAFGQLLDRATTPPGLPSGRILLLWGESGSGKTHLMRAFRNAVHARRVGYCGYMQMTSASTNYSRYILSNLIDSLDKPYFEPDGPASGLMRLSNALAETPFAILPHELIELRQKDFSDEEVVEFVGALADLIVTDDRYSALDIDVVRALLFLQRNEPRLQSRVLKFLRCEELSPLDRQSLGGMAARAREDEPERMVEMLGRVMWAMQSVSLVVLVDQLEEMYHLENAAESFRRAMAAICALADRIPSSVFVICCLENYYDKLRGHLTRSTVDRLENDPEPILLAGLRSREEIEQIVKNRLLWLYEELEVPFREEEPTFPIPPAGLGLLTNMRTRDVLDNCRAFRNRCISAERIVPFTGEDRAEPAPVVDPAPVQAVEALAQEWNDFRSGTSHAPPEGDMGLTALLAESIKATAEEIPDGLRFSAETDGSKPIIEVVQQNADGIVRRFSVGVCNKSARGGALARQIAELESCAAGEPPVVVRSTAFPKDPRTQIAKQLAELLKRGGRRAVVEDSDWRAMRAFQDFRRLKGQSPAWQEWLRQERPLGQLGSLQAILELEKIKAPVEPCASPERAPSPLVLNDAVAPEHSTPDRSGSEPSRVEEPDKPVAAAKATESPPGELVAGVSRGRLAEPVTLGVGELTQHAAFLGESGSGKTTLALNLIEQLLLQGIPAVLVDRKGDLCGYARPEAWSCPHADSELSERRRRLQGAVDVSVFTPGNPAGRPLSIAICPSGLGHLPSHEREEVAHHAAFALGEMMAYKTKGADASRLAILKQAVNLLVTLEPDRSPALNDVIALIDDGDPDLVDAIGKLDPKLNKKLVQDLETLRLNRRNLLAEEGERLDLDVLLGGKGEKKTRLSIISTKFLGDPSSVDFWVAQLLLETGRWASRNPSSRLQAVLLFDEADLYLPAVRQPATKGPMESLLKRARAAGIGILLASQSPGDFDYKCRDTIRTWFTGRITQRTSIDKMAPMLSDCRVNVAAKLPSQQTGQFYLIREGEAIPFLARRSVVSTEQLPEQEILALARRSRK